MFKNVASKVALFAFDTTTGVAKTGDAANLTAYVSKDYGATTVLADTSATEQDATNAKGWYLFDVAQTESNADALLFTAKSTTANIAIVGQYIHTTPASFTSFVTPTGATVVIDQTTVLTTTPVANTVGEALFMADIQGGRFGTAQAGAASTITLDAGASAIDGRYVGYDVFLYGGTGGGVRGVGQARTIVAYNGTTKVATLAQAWGTNPDNTSKFMLIVNPFSNVGIWNGTVVATPATAGIPDVNAKNWNNLPTVALPLVPTTAGRTLDVSATGEAGLDWANVGSPTTSLALTGTTIAVTQKVDVETIKTQAVTAAAGVIFPTSIASPTNITAGIITTTTNVTNDVGITQAGADKVWGTAARTLTSFGTLAADVWAVATRVLTAGTNIVLAKGVGVTGFNDPAASANADAVWDELLSGHAVSGSAGEALSAAGSAADPWATALPGAYSAGQAGKIVGDNINATISSRAVAGDAMALTSGERTSLAGVVWATVMEGSRTAIQYMRGFGATLLGKASGMATTTATFRDVDDSKDRVVATVDADGNRSAITLDLT